MRMVVFVIFLLSSVAAWAEEPVLAKLSSADYQVRDEGQRELVSWVLQRGEEAKDFLLQEYLRSPDPEVRARLLRLLERAYFPSRGYVGVVMRPIFPENRGWRLEGEGLIFEGVVVTRVAENTPAEAAGLKMNDVIRKVNEWKVAGGQDLTAEVAREIQKHPPGAAVSLTILRDGEEIVVELKLGVLPVPSERIRSLREDQVGEFFVVPAELRAEVSEFQKWLAEKIANDAKKLVAD